MEGGYKLSTNIDKNIVEMKFDNSDFEKNVSTSMSTLDKLKESLKFENVLEGFKNLGKAADDVSFESLNSETNSVASGFVALEEIAIGALRRIGEKIVDVGANMASSLTVEPIARGWSKYNAQMESVQALLYNTTMEEDEIYKVLDRLSIYADGTSYSLENMVDALKKFVVSGMDVNEAADMIVGIGNAGALAGAGMDQVSASFGYYTKIAAKGYAQTQEIASLMETSQTWSTEFTKRVIDAAKSLGYLTKEGTVAKNGFEVTTETFRDSLQYNWLAFDVLKEVVGDYGAYTNTSIDLIQEEGNGIDSLTDAEELLGEMMDDVSYKGQKAAAVAKNWTDTMAATGDAVSSQWSRVFEQIFGAYTEAAELFTSLQDPLYNLFAQPVSDLADLLTEWNKLGGRVAILEAIKQLWIDIGKVVEPVKNAFVEVFGVLTGSDLKKLTDNFLKFAKSLEITDETAQKIQNGFRGVFSVINTVGKSIKWVVDNSTPVLKSFGNFVGDIFLDLFSTMGQVWEATSSFRELLSFTVKPVQKLLNKITNFLTQAR